MASNQTTSLREVIARVFWMMVGPSILALLLLSIMNQGKGWLAPSSIAFPMVLAAVIFARWFDPRTSDGEPAAPNDFGRYAVRTLVLGSVVWVVANLLGIHWLGA